MVATMEREDKPEPKKRYGLRCRAVEDIKKGDYVVVDLMSGCVHVSKKSIRKDVKFDG
jgi:ribosomal silencing factor RsfS